MCHLTKATSYRLDDQDLKPSKDKNSPPQHKTYSVYNLLSLLSKVYQEFFHTAVAEMRILMLNFTWCQP